MSSSSISKARTRVSPDISFGPGVPGRESLGAETLDDLLGSGTGLLDEARIELVSETKTRIDLRYPLPGTPDASGNLTGSPRGAGTGWVRLVRYREASFVESVRSRFTAPRSESLAARDWNLICALRASGVGTPEPLAVGGDGRRSFLVTRELTNMVRATDFFVVNRSNQVRSDALVALGTFLGRVLRSGVRLPRLDAGAIFIGLPKAVCEGEEEPIANKRIRRLPPVVLTDVSGGRLGKLPSLRASAEWLESLVRSLDRRVGLSEREFYSIFSRSLRGASTKLERSTLWNYLVGKRS